MYVRRGHIGNRRRLWLVLFRCLELVCHFSDLLSLGFSGQLYGKETGQKWLESLIDREAIAAHLSEVVASLTAICV